MDDPREAKSPARISADVRLESINGEQADRVPVVEHPNTGSVDLPEEDGKRYSVVDGQQCLTSIKAYLEGRFPDGKDFRLSGLQILADLKGKLFRELPENQQEAITGAVLRVISITKDSDPDVKFEVFERLNLGSVKLNDQELRNCMFRGSYNNLLAELVLSKPFRRIFGTSEPDTRTPFADPSLLRDVAEDPFEVSRTDEGISQP